MGVISNDRRYLRKETLSEILTVVFFDPQFVFSDLG